MKKHVTFAFGRFNPPTIGHKKLVDLVEKSAAGGDFYIFASQSQDPDKNPLDYQTKIKFLRRLFPEVQDKIVEDITIKNVLQAADKLKSLGYTDATFICGSDRIPDFTRLLTNWNNMDKVPRFNTLNILSSGEREDGAEGVEGVSASQAREFVKNNDFESFKGTVPNDPSLAMDLYNAVKQGMVSSKKKIKECLIRIINEVLNEDDAKIKAATKKTKQALVLQRQEELRGVTDKIKVAQEKSRTTTSPEDKSASSEEIKKLNDEQKSKLLQLKAAKDELNSVN